MGWLGLSDRAKCTSTASTYRGFEGEPILFEAAEIDLTLGGTVGGSFRIPTRWIDPLFILGAGASYNRLEKDDEAFSEVRPFLREGMEFERATSWGTARASITFNDHLGGRGISFVPVTVGIVF